MKALAAIILCILLMFGPLLCWGVNVYKLTQCDFAAPYKCEAIHGAGLIPGAALVTVWFGTDEEEAGSGE